MEIALTLVVNPGCPTGPDQIADEALSHLSISVHKRKTLAENKALDILFDYVPAELVTGKLAARLNDIEGLDWCAQPAEGRRKKLLLADMDSTMITIECIDELADFVGVKAQVSVITEAAMRGELNFEGALRERVALLKGLKREALEQCYVERVKIMPGARELVQTVKANGGYSVLVSGGFTYFTERVAAAIGFDVHRANTLEFNDSELTGTVREPICGAQAKLHTLQEFAQKLSLTKQQILAVGDGANDIPMIQAAGLGVAFHAKPKTRDAASAAATYGDLTSLLYFQGYGADEFKA